MIMKKANQAELTKLSVQELRKELANGLTMTAAGLAYMAAVWGELERRGEDMGELRVGMGRLLPLIASGRLAAEAVVAFAGRPIILRYLEGMDIKLQRRLADGEMIPVYLQGEKEPQAMPLVRIPPKAIPHVIRDGVICTPAEQRLAMSPKKRTPERAQPRYSAVVNKSERTIKIGNTSAPIATVTAALAEAAGRVGEIVDTEDRPAKVRGGKFTDDECERIQAAAKSQGIPEWEFIRRCVMAWLV